MTSLTDLPKLEKALSALSQSDLAHGGVQAVSEGLNDNSGRLAPFNGERHLAQTDLNL
jgi:hypothetical protein